MARDPLITDIEWLTRGVRVVRIIREIRRQEMAKLIEIRGLGAAVAAAKKGISDVRSETAGLSTDASALVSAIQDVRQQIRQAQDDLKFEAETLGNSGGNSQELQEPSDPPKPTTPPANDLSPVTREILDGRTL